MIPDWDQFFIADALAGNPLNKFSTGLERSIIDDFIEKNPGGVMMDIGSNMGYWSLYMSKYYEVHAFEPDPENFKCLEYNIKNNHVDKCYDIKTYNMAISDSAKNISTFRHTTGLNCGMISVRNDDESDIPAVTLDSLKIENIKILKVDTEGHGYYVLCGATETLKNQSPMIVIETNNLENVIYNLPENILEEKLTSMGYVRIFQPDDAPGTTSNSIFIKR